MKGFVDCNECVKHLNTSIYSVLKVKFSVGRCANFCRKNKVPSELLFGGNVFILFLLHIGFILN